MWGRACRCLGVPNGICSIYLPEVLWGDFVRVLASCHKGRAFEDTGCENREGGQQGLLFRTIIGKVQRGGFGALEETCLMGFFLKSRRV